MNMKTESNCCSKLSLPARMGRWWSTWMGRRSRIAEVDNLDPALASEISRDLGTRVGELRALAGKWPDTSAELLGRRLKALDLDPAEISRAQPATARDLAARCSLCNDKTRCRHDLDRNPGAPGWQEYCVNTTTIAALKSEHDERKKGSQP
jgi:hypothetical protein